MFKKLLVIIPVALAFASVQVNAYSTVMPATMVKEAKTERVLLGQQEMDLNSRYFDPYINDVFKDNILLNFSYLSDNIQNASQIDWNAVRTPSTHEFTLQPGEVFAYHDAVLPQFQGRVVKIGGSHFGGGDGYRSSGNLYGDGVCHFASLINWSAQTAGLGVTAPTNHNFAMIPGINPIYGTAIYYVYGQPEVSMQQNLYVENTYDHPVTFVFTSDGDTLRVSIYK